MSCSPLTPDKADPTKNAPSRSTMLSAEKPVPATKVKEASLNEPSPASTYGDTARSSTPATPMETGAHDITSTITHSMRAAQLDPAIKSISGSPVSAHDAKYLSASAHPAACTTFSEIYPNSSKTGTAENNNRTSPTSSSPSSGRTHDVRSARTWRARQDGDFVSTLHHGTDDPFISSGDTQESQPSDSSGALAYHPDKIGVTPTNNTAQAIFSPQACVFVANLTQSDTDDQLEYAVTQAFQQFGNVYVKIRRDARQMPFAFAQYTNVDDAQRAITLGRGMPINGRPCRTEVARVNRSLYLSKINGGSIAEGEAREIMAGGGPIEMLWYASQTEREMFGLPEGIFIRFAFFDDCRDAQAGFRESSLYRLEQVKGLEDTRALPGGRPQYSSSPFRRESPGSMISPATVRRNADSRSIFIGNVPQHITEDQLSSMFQMYGRIMHCEIIRKPSIVNASGVNAFSFIEYEHPQAALLAVQASPRVCQGLNLRVEHKEPSNSAQRILRGFNGSPRRMGILDSQDVLVAFQRGVSMGMNQAAQAQMMPSPVYTQYPYYTAFDPSAAQQSVPPPTSSNESATSPLAYGNGYASQGLGQFQYPTTPASYGHYQQPQQQYIIHNPLIPQYQWPPTSASNDNTGTDTPSG